MIRRLEKARHLSRWSSPTGATSLDRWRHNIPHVWIELLSGFASPDAFDHFHKVAEPLEPSIPVLGFRPINWPSCSLDVERRFCRCKEDFTTDWRKLSHIYIVKALNGWVVPKPFGKAFSFVCFWNRFDNRFHNRSKRPVGGSIGTAIFQDDESCHFKNRIPCGFTSITLAGDDVRQCQAFIPLNSSYHRSHLATHFFAQ